MNDKLVKAMELASQNEELKSQLMDLKDIKDTEVLSTKVVEILKGYGIDLTVEDLLERNDDLSEEELAAVTGGVMQWEYIDFQDNKSYYSISCSCLLTGAGGKDEYMNTCICFWGGYGSFTDYGKEYFETDDSAMICVALGQNSDYYGHRV